MKRIVFFSLCIFSFYTMYAQSIPEMINVPDGEYIMGSNTIPSEIRVEDNDIPLVKHAEHNVKLDEFRISKYEITFSEYFKFLNDTQYVTIADQFVMKFLPEIGDIQSARKYYNDQLYPNYPVVKIAYEDALLYCLWLSRKTGKTYRLPTEAEWEYAATGGDMILFPWGNEYRQLDKSHSIEWIVDASFKKDIFPIDKYPEDKSSFGVYGMYGNAQEWCIDAFDPEYDFKCPYENPVLMIKKYDYTLSARGLVGYALLENVYLGLKSRYNRSPAYFPPYMGFRVVEEEKPTLFNKNTVNESTFYYKNGILNDSYVNVREEPSLEGNKLFQLSKGERVRVYYRSSQKMSIGDLTDYWYCIRRLDTEVEKEMATGWIFGPYLDLEEIQFSEDYKSTITFSEKKMSVQG